jgi:hypothetical protein
MAVLMLRSQLFLPLNGPPEYHRSLPSILLVEPGTGIDPRDETGPGAIT